MSKLGQFFNERLKVTDVLHEDDEQSPPWWEEGSTMEIKRDDLLRASSICSRLVTWTAICLPTAKVLEVFHFSGVRAASSTCIT